MGRRTDIDWEAIERDYRAGIMSVRAIGKAHGVSHTAIQNKADAEGWVRDLAAKIHAAAENKLAKQAVAKKNATANTATERQIIEANAEVITNVVLKHRDDITAARELAMQMLAELRGQTDGQDVIEKLAEMLADPETDMGKLADLARKITSLPSRVDTLSKLAQTLRTLIDKEREAFSVGDTPADSSKVTRVELVAL